ncbi:MAG TPA: 1-(5-phosphoribosyl)-5-[(5-phosphoribosylamino)methylideneamino] imidazole-4-carboxamide isomerase [Gemmatimonadaceae bacterium]
MIAIPAVDLRGGACVQLVGGSFDDERIRLPDPIESARRWADAGFSRLHVVDLDAAAGTGENTGVIDDIMRGRATRVTVGGGIRSEERVEQLIAAGADAVVVGTRGIEDRSWLREVAVRFPKRVVLAADVRDRSVVVRAWAERTDIDVIDLVRDVDSLPLAGLLITAVHREGRLAGPDLELITDVVRATRLPVLASGGIATLDDLRAVQACGATGCVIGMALYSGALDARAVAAEFNT